MGGRGRGSRGQAGGLGLDPELVAEVRELLTKAAAKGKGDQVDTVFAPAQREPESLLLDPHSWYQTPQDYMERPSTLNWGHLKKMAAVPLVAAIVKTLTNDASSFCTPSDSPYSPGFKIKMRATKRSPTRSDERMMEQLTTFLLNCGTITDSRQLLVRPSFGTFGKLVIRDSLVYDQGTAEIVPNNAGKLGGRARPAQMVAVDGSTIRVAQTTKDGRALPDTDWTTARHVQIIDSIVVNEYAAGQLLYGVRNPTADIMRSGYGTSETEMMVILVTAWVNAIAYNSRQFSQGVGAKGLLNIKSPNLSDKALRAFKRDLELLVMGVSNAGRLPVTAADAIEFVSFQGNNKELEYGAWMDLLHKLGCALFEVDPAVVNFVYGNTGQKGAMSGADAADRIQSSRSRGLRNLVKSFFDWINTYIIWQLDPNFEVVTTGLIADSETAELDMDAKKVANYVMVDEIRARRDMPPLPDGKGQVILNPTWLQASQAADANKQQQDQGQDQGMDAASLFPDQGQDDGQGDQGEPAEGQPGADAAPPAEGQPSAEGAPPAGEAPAGVVQPGQLQASQRRVRRVAFTV